MNVPVFVGDGDDVSSNLFIGTLEDIKELPTDAGESKTNYILNKIDGVIGFYLANGKNVAAGKAYLQVPGNSVRAFFGFGDFETGINIVEAQPAALSTGAYDLQGRRIAAPAKGLYIVNGKKMLVK